ncbi:galactose-proton symport [Rhexocercosporidium sp. MPI-PUGE-AT-0058]|nr:galactose-proton symport [Rhexocercosporidium sp. MPI-PUGE-AT-0058]
MADQIPLDNLANASNPTPITVKVNINENTEAILQNSLRRFTPEELTQWVTEFAVAHGFEKEDIHRLLHVAAQIARDPFAPQSAERLNDAELLALRDENLRPFHQPGRFWLTIFLCSSAAILQGWAQVGTNPANASWPQEFGYNPESSKGAWYIGIVNSAPFFAGAFIGCWCSVFISDRYGRRPTLLFAAIFSFASALGSAGSQSFVQLLMCRLLLGVGMGAKASITAVFAAEVSPSSVRGSIVMGSWQICVAIGILLGFSANLAVSTVRHNLSWRLQLGSAFIPSIPVLFIYLCPESPRYLIKKGKYRQAYTALCKLRNTPLQAARDLIAIAAQIEVENEIFQANGYTGSMYIKRFFQLFSQPRIRRATVASSITMIGQQLCGINVLIQFSTTLFISADHEKSTSKALWISWGIGAINVVCGLPALWLIDRVGRRVLLLFLAPHLAWTMLVAGSGYLIPEGSESHLPLITAFSSLFVALYSSGQGPVPFCYSAEAQPVTHREVGASFAVAMNLFWLGILTLFYPALEHKWNGTSVLGLFAGLNVIQFILIFFLVPETKEFSLEELDCVFGVKTRIFARHKAEYLVKWVKHYCLRRNGVVFNDLYDDRRRS